MAKYNVHAGHCPSGKGASGAVGLLNESNEAREVKKEVIELLRELGHTAYDCTCDKKKTQDGCISYILSKCNKHSVTCDVSIHLNSGRKDKNGDNKTGGVEVWIYSNVSKSKDEATRICKEVSSELGITNRGVKTSTGLAVLRKTKSPALLVECCFVDDKDDYKKWNAKKCAKAIVKGLTGKTANTVSTTTATSKQPYKVVKKTSEKEAIKWLQKKLNGCYAGKLADLSVDGIWGQKTQAMLKAYWKQLGWFTGGSYAGKKTCTALHKNRKK